MIRTKERKKAGKKSLYDKNKNHGGVNNNIIYKNMLYYSCYNRPTVWSMIK